MRMSDLSISLALLPALWLGAGPGLGASASDTELPQLIADLAGPDAVAESQASRRLVELADAAVPALALHARKGNKLAGRLLAVDVLGRIGTPAATEALIDLLREERNLAVRGQVCLQLGYARDRRAIPVLTEWLRTIGPTAINDVPGPKELQPSTCYLRHIEALGMIGDEQSIPVLQEFAAKVPPGVGMGGFLTNFVRSGVDEAIEEIRDRAAFQKALRQHPQLEEKIAPLMQHLRRDPVARFRLHESELIRHTRQARILLQKLATDADAAVAAGAKALLANWDTLAI